MVLLAVAANVVWLEYGGGPRHTGVQALQGGMSASPVELWSVSGSFVVMGAVAGDVDGDDTVEVIAGNNGDSLVWINGITGAIEHVNTLADMAFVGGQMIGDLDPTNPGLEVAATSGWLSAYLYLYDSTASERWRTALSGYDASAMHAADVDGDGGLEIAVANDSYIFVCDDDGSVLWSQQNGWHVSVPALADADGDGSLEVVAHRHRNDSGYTRVLDAATGALEWERARPEAWSNGWAAGPNPTVADVDGDGQLEVIDSYADTLNPLTVCYDASGNEEWSVPVGSFASPSVADLDGDGSVEVVLVGGLKRHNMDTVFVYSIQGGSPNLLWTRSGFGEMWRKALLWDADGDGDLDVLVATWSGYLVAFDGPTGQVLWSLSIGAAPAYSVIAADLDGDSLSELVVNAYGKLVAYDERPAGLGESGRSGFRVEAGLGWLLVSAPEARVELYSADGRLLDELSVKGSARLAVPGRGVVLAVVKAGGRRVVKPVIAEP